MMQLLLIKQVYLKTYVYAPEKAQHQLLWQCRVSKLVRRAFVQEYSDDRSQKLKKLFVLASTWATVISQNLHIEKLNGVRRVDQELYGDSCYSSFKPFGSLETLLTFEGMLKWRKWDCAAVEFPCLGKLYMKKCPKLRRDLPKHLPLLMKLHISECQLLMNPLPIVPSICKLELNEYKAVTFWNSYQRE